MAPTRIVVVRTALYGAIALSLVAGCSVARETFPEGSPAGTAQPRQTPTAPAEPQASGTGDGAQVPDVAYLMSPGATDLRKPLSRYASDRANLRRFYDVATSPTRRARMRRFYASWLSSLEQVDFDALSQDGRIEYILFTNQLAYELRRLDRGERRVDEMSDLVPFAGTITDLQERRRRVEPLDHAKSAAALTAMSKQIKKLRKRLTAGLKPVKGEASDEKDTSETDTKDDLPPIKVEKKTVAFRAAGEVDSLRKTLQGWFKYYDGYDPLFTWWAGDPYKKVDKALTGYAAFLRERVVGLKKDDKDAIVGDPLQEEALLSDLEREMIPYTPKELIDIANREFAWCEKEMLRASNDLGYGDKWREALEHVKTLHVEPGKQPELVRDLAREAIAFLEANDLVTVPPLAAETWRMEMMSPKRQKATPYFTGGETISVAFPTSGMSHEQKLMSMRGNNVHFSRATVHHELIPGHHLQGFMTARYKTHRRIFSTPFWGEGWALYWEMLLWDLDFAQSAENRVGMLFWRMHRCARIIFSLSFHLELMTPEECIDFLVERVGHERNNATAEVRRSFSGEYSPLYQCAYMIGGLQFRALHRELVESGSMTNRAFHDAILKENRIPVEMVRAKLTNQPLTRDFRSRWRFYDVEAKGN